MHREKIYGSAEISAEKRKYSNFLLQKNIYMCFYFDKDANALFKHMISQLFNFCLATILSNAFFVRRSSDWRTFYFFIAKIFLEKS